MNELGVAPALEIKTMSWEHAYTGTSDHVKSKIEQDGLKLIDPDPELMKFVRGRDL